MNGKLSSDLLIETFVPVALRLALKGRVKKYAAHDPLRQCFVEDINQFSNLLSETCVALALRLALRGGVKK